MRALNVQLPVLVVCLAVLHAQPPTDPSQRPTASPTASPTIEAKNAAWKEIGGLLLGWFVSLVCDALYQLLLLCVLLWFAFGHLYGEFKQITYSAQQQSNNPSAKDNSVDSQDTSEGGASLDDMMETNWAGVGMDLKPQEHTLFHVLQRALRLHTPDYLASEGQGAYDHVSAPCIGVPVPVANSGGNPSRDKRQRRERGKWHWITYGDVHRRSADIAAGLESLELLHCPAPLSGTGIARF